MSDTKRKVQTCLEIKKKKCFVKIKKLSRWRSSSIWAREHGPGRFQGSPILKATMQDVKLSHSISSHVTSYSITFELLLFQECFGDFSRRMQYFILLFLNYYVEWKWELKCMKHFYTRFLRLKWINFTFLGFKCDFSLFIFIFVFFNKFRLNSDVRPCQHTEGSLETDRGKKRKLGTVFKVPTPNFTVCI